MGKQKQSAKAKEKRLSQAKRNELSSLVDVLLCATKDLSSVSPTGALNHIDDEFLAKFLQMNGILERIRKLEAEVKKPTHNKVERDSTEVLEKFCDWCREQGAKFDKVKVAKLPGYDLGLQATADLHQNEVFIEIPQRLLFSFARLQERLPTALQQIPLFENMSHIRLAFLLMVESLRADSVWRPYLDVLPDKYRTCFYMTPADLLELKGCNALPKLLRQIQFIAGQYAFLYKYLQKCDGTDEVVQLLRDHFSYDLYW